MTNREFSQNNPDFRAACEAVKIAPTTRQASKWRGKNGKAWQWYLHNHRNGDATPIDSTERNP